MGRIPEGFKKASNSGYRKSLSKSELLEKKAEVIKKHSEAKAKEMPPQHTAGAFKVSLSQKPASAETGGIIPGIQIRQPQQDENVPSTEVHSVAHHEKARSLLQSSMLPGDQKKALGEILNKDEK